jgi:hypothetical protein
LLLVGLVAVKVLLDNTQAVVVVQVDFVQL